MVAPPDNEVLSGRSLHHAHQGSPALLGVSLGVRAGEILGIAGPRGAGKTTLLSCLSGQLVPDAGEVWFDGSPLHTLSPGARDRIRRDHFGWIGPEPRLVPELTARENAALPLLLAGAAHRSATRAAQEWLERLDVGDLATARPDALTQAQRQRVAIARALVTQPRVLFADEPAAPLHSADRTQVLRTLTTAARSHGITVLLATTDTDAATLHADHVLLLTDGTTEAGAGAPAPSAEGEGAGAPAEVGAAAPSAEVGAGSGSGSGVGSGTASGSGSGSGVGVSTGAGSGAGVSSGADANGEAGSDTGAGSGAGSPSDVDGGPVTEDVPC